MVKTEVDSESRRISLKAKIIFSLIPLGIFLALEIIARIIVPPFNPLTTIGEPEIPLIEAIPDGEAGFIPVMNEESKKICALPLPAHPYHELDNERFYRLIPNFSLTFHAYNDEIINYSTNSLGFRDEEFPVKKSKDRVRIICTGDSSTFGCLINICDAYPTRLENMLLKKTKEKNAEVINAGVIGYSSYQGLKFFEKTLRRLEPDILIAAWGYNDSALAVIPHSQVSNIGLNSIGLSSTLNKIGLYRLAERMINKIKRICGFKRKYVQKVSPDEYRANLEKLASYCEEDDIMLILIPLTAPKPYYESMIKVASECNGVEFVDVEKTLGEYYDKFISDQWVPFRDLPRWPLFKLKIDEKQAMRYGSDEMVRIRQWSHVFMDFCHPNPMGYLIIADTLYDYLVNKGIFTKTEPVKIIPSISGLSDNLID